MSASYRFLPYVREGFAAGLTQADGLGRALPAQRAVPVKLQVNQRQDASVAVDVHPYGPGDVASVDARNIIRRHPTPFTPDFEPDQLALVEFDQPDFPWLFTPAGPDPQGRVRPWLCLVVVRRQAGVALRFDAMRPLPVLSIEPPADPARELPDLGESWAWAHAQVIQDDPAASLEAILSAPSDRTLSRLLCPRRLEPGAQYFACLVPTLDAGRLAGLGLEVPEAATTLLQPAWPPVPDLPDRVQLPVYHQWEFATGPGGDFESLAGALRPRPAGEGVGTRPIDVGQPGFGLPGLGVRSFDGALRPVRSTAPAPVPDAEFERRLQDLLAGPEPGADPLVSPPIYGGLHAVKSAVSADGWLGDLNLDPVRRATAGLGALVVRDQQESLMEAAWEQFGQAGDVAQMVRRVPLAEAVLTSVIERRMRPLEPEPLLQMAAPALARLTASSETLLARVRRAGLPAAVASAPLRRVLRSRGPLTRRVEQSTKTRVTPRLVFSKLIRPPAARVVTVPDAVTTTALGELVGAERSRMRKARAAGQATPAGERHLAAATELHTYLARAETPRLAAAMTTLDLAELKTELLDRLDPSATVPGRTFARLRAAGAPVPPQPATTPADLGRGLPTFDTPMYCALRDLAQEYLLPGAEGIPPDTMTLLEANRPFVEAFMLGLNHEMARELLWREFPAHARHTAFRRFWDTHGSEPELPPIDTWDPALGLGNHLQLGDEREPLVLLVRGQLLLRYPDTIVLAVKGASGTSLGTEEILPIFHGRLEPDITFVGFDLGEPEARDGWFFVLQEQPTAPRFGLDVSRSGPLAGWDDLAWTDIRVAPGEHVRVAAVRPKVTGGPRWGFNAAHMAGILRQRPVRVAIRADLILPRVMPATGDIASRLRELASVLGDLPAAEVPLALAPVQLETRFVGDELLVRIRPDALSLDAHEPELTAREIELGQTYWQTVWRAGNDADRRLAAWAQLAGQFGEQRSAWIARILTPENLTDRPARAVADGQQPPKAPRFPAPAQKADAWTQPVFVRGEPDRWVLFGYRAGQRVLLAWGAPVTPRLAVTPAPGAPQPQPVADDALAIEDGLRWLVDFAEAERVGMGIRTALAPGEAAKGFDVLLALGVKTGDQPDAGGRGMAALLAAQVYTDGLAFPAPDTPTNNTESALSGFSSGDARDFEPARAARRTVVTGSNAAFTAAALGVDPDVFLDAPGAGVLVDRDAEAMLTALWPATGGYMLEQFLDGAAEAERSRRDARRHVLRHLRAGGPLPCLRIGAQPYGLLPVTTLDRLKPQGAGEERALRWLRSLQATWRAAVAGVPRAAAGDGVFDGLRLDAASVGYRGRVIVDKAFFGAAGVPQSGSGPPQGPLQRRTRLQEALHALGEPGQPRLLDVVPVGAPFEIASPLVQGGEPADYLNRIRQATFTELERETVPDTLLYRLVRHSVLLAYGMAGYRMLIAAGEIPLAAYREPSLIDVAGSAEPQRTETLTRLLARRVPALGDAPLRDIIHRVGAAQHPEAAELDELRAALAHLATLPPGTLERLLPETLDLFAYRLDAWVTSLATKRLAERRQTHPRALAIGGYGWVEQLRPQVRTPVATPPAGEAGPRLFADPQSGGALHVPSLAQAATGAILRSGFLSQRGEQDQRPLAVDVSSERVRRAAWLLDGIRQGQSLTALLGYRFERGLHDRGLDRYIAVFRRVAPLGELAEAEVAKRDADAEVARLVKAGHPDLAAAQQDVIRFDKQLATLKAEKLVLPKKLKAAQDEVANLDKILAPKRSRLAALQKLVEGGLGGRGEEARDLAADISALERRRTVVDRERKRLLGRKAAIDGEIATATLNLKNAKVRVTELKTAPHPRLAAARAKAASAQRAFDELLDAYRKRYVLPQSADFEALQSLAEVQVVDGWELLQLYKAGRWDQRVDVGADRPALVAELDALADTVDAVADVLTTESVFQLARGNPERAGAALDAVVHGDIAPPELEAIQTPTTGVSLTHRVAVLFAGAPPQLPKGWTTDERQARAAAEPYLNAWAGRVIGSPARVRCRAEYLDAEGTVLRTRELRLSELPLSPLDIVYAAPPGHNGTLVALERLLAHHARSTPPAGIPADTAVRIDVTRAKNWQADELGLVEVVEITQALRKLFDGARPLAAGDLAHPARPAQVPVDEPESARRADAAVRALRDARDQLAAATAPAAVRDALLRCFFAGIAEAMPEPGAEAVQAGVVLREAARRLDAVEQEAPLRRLELVFGGTFRAVSRLVASDAFEAADALLSADPLVLPAWVQRMAQVRPGTAHLQNTLLYAAAVSTPELPLFTLAQLPRAAGERWVGLDGTMPPDGRLSVVAHLPFGGKVRPGRTLAGLVLDEWAEVVPSQQQVTGTAFHVDAPSSRAPNALLLAVAPGDRPRWDVEAIEATLLETLELARLRTVDPLALSKGVGLGPALPALYFGLNRNGDTVSTDFKPVA